MPIRTMIIDDDPFIQDLLRDKLEQHFEQIEVVSIAGGGEEGIEKIKSLKPALVFLDVEMSDMTGFEMLSQIETINFKVIFITSYSHYAIKAIRFNALDYLLKPIDLGELKAAINRFEEQQEKDPSAAIKLALANMRASHDDQLLHLKTQDGELELKLSDIIRIEGDRNYSNIFLTNGKKELVSKTLSTMEELLEDKQFFRCHKSHLINQSHVVDNKKKLSIVLSDGTEVPLARRKKDEFQHIMQSAADQTN